MGLHTEEKSMEVAKKENAVIAYEKDYSVHYEGYDPNSAESFIIFTLMQNTHLSQSLEFAGYIQNKLEKSAERANRGLNKPVSWFFGKLPCQVFSLKLVIFPIRRRKIS